MQLFKKQQAEPESQQQIEIKKNREGFKKQYFQLEKTINQLGKTLKFKKKQNQDLTTILLVGVTGSGKSTSGNALLSQYCKENGLKKDYEQFQSKKSITSVTKYVSHIIVDNLCVIDSPGFNDPDKKLPDDYISQITCNFLQNNVLQNELGFGINGIIQCIQIDKSGRFDKCQVQCLAQIFLTFTLQDENSQEKQSPRINILFTNLSETELDIHHNNEEGENTSLNKSNFIKQYKNFLVQNILNLFNLKDEQKIIKKRKLIIDKVDKFLPAHNFYWFKTYKNNIINYQNKNKAEQQIIKKIIKDNKEHGNFILHDKEDQQLMPVLINKEQRDIVIKNINEILKQCEQQLNQAVSNYKKFTNGKQNQILEDWIKVNKEVFRKFDDLQNKFPEAFLKFPQQLYDSFKIYLLKQEYYLSELITQEVGKFNQEEKEKLNKKSKEKKQQFEEQKREFQEKIENCQRLIQKQRQDLNNLIAEKQLKLDEKKNQILEQEKLWEKQKNQQESIIKDLEDKLDKISAEIEDQKKQFQRDQNRIQENQKLILENALKEELRKLERINQQFFEKFEILQQEKQKLMNELQEDQKQQELAQQAQKDLEEKDKAKWDNWIERGTYAFEITSFAAAAYTGGIIFSCSQFIIRQGVQQLYSYAKQKIYDNYNLNKNK
ncbi:P-loop containing nucleoside triphosphate hydrolase [Pseudocohnilembus persalinus]|uniref:p-loop containing nucleoside triphosphate hydrolase n=1 Tax=Pseudocohnilembus persalinus TaxID=266149 RepID=A0A0V0QM29_PSEPJ|nr:P-loop containing nucleoside triphosphate hydrolase [Pseudocohnilembus persalinus]|eukprot:KRX03268.1 P-loop containing nucleoside triphosphate hydrolase [Pseudocohnilembus persalinus]